MGLRDVCNLALWAPGWGLITFFFPYEFLEINNSTDDDIYTVTYSVYFIRVMAKNDACNIYPVTLPLKFLFNEIYTCWKI